MAGNDFNKNPFLHRTIMGTRRFWFFSKTWFDILKCTASQGSVLILSAPWILVCLRQEAYQLFFLIRKWPVWSPRPSTPTSDEDSLAFCKYRAEDISGGRFEDFVCRLFAKGFNVANLGYFPMARYLAAHSFGESPIRKINPICSSSTESLSSAPLLPRRLTD